VKNPLSENLISVAALLSASLLWGASFMAMRMVLAVLPAPTVMWLRMVLALLFILPFAPRLLRFRYRRGDLLILIPLVLFQPCLYFLAESNALTLTSASQAGVISACVPLLVSLGAWFFLKESITRRTILGLGISIGGVVLLTLAGSPSETVTNPVLGNLLETGAMICAAANMILVKKVSGRYNPWTLTAFQTAAGFLFFLPGAAGLSAGGWQTVLRPEILLPLAYLGGGSSLLAFGLYNWGLSRGAASRASLFINLVPLFAVFFAWVFLREGLSLLQIPAGASVVAGAFLAGGGGREAGRETGPAPGRRRGKGQSLPVPAGD